LATRFGLQISKLLRFEYISALFGVVVIVRVEKEIQKTPVRM